MTCEGARQETTEPRSPGHDDGSLAGRTPRGYGSREAGAREEGTAMKRPRQHCYFCATPIERATGQRVAVCGQCPDSAMWQAIWRGQRREP
jgi:hypothetical protein